MHTMEVAGSGGRPVRAVSHGPQEAPAVFVAHGFKGFKDWGMFPWWAEQLAAAGLRAIRFDFSHNGVEARDFDRLDLFLLDTPVRHQEDLQALAAAISGPLGILGHSRGGGDAIVFARAEPRVRCVATLASVASQVPAMPDLEEVVREKGFYPFPNARTGQVMPVARSAFDEGALVSVEEAARALDRPLLLVHGTSDESVPPASLRRIAGWKPDAETFEVEGAGHTFGAVHPFQGPTPHLEQAAERVVAFFTRHLLGS